MSIEQRSLVFLLLCCCMYSYYIGGMRRFVVRSSASTPVWSSKTRLHFAPVESSRTFATKSTKSHSTPSKRSQRRSNIWCMESTREKILNLSDRITVVSDEKRAKEVLSILYSNSDKIWACDTEVADIDVKIQGPVGNGKVICASVYGGPEVDFGDGPGSALWIDNLGAAEGVLQIFKPWFESNEHKKVWHNYGFDRHVMNNEGIDCKGFAGDTMHMARLWDTSRDKASGGTEGYSLESLSSELIGDPKFAKTSMKDLFGVAKKLKDGSESKVKDLPELREVQESPDTRERWIQYSALDAIATWHVRDELVVRLKMMPWIIEDTQKLGNMFEYYEEYMLPFGELLTDMESAGIKVDTDGHLKEAEVRAREERGEMLKRFMTWVAKYCSDAQYINTASTAQMQQLFFGHYEEEQLVAKERSFKVEKTDDEIERENMDLLLLNPYANCSVPEIKLILKERKLKVSGKKIEIINRLMQDDMLQAKFGSMSQEELRDVCLSKGLKAEGTQEDMIERVKADEFFLLEADKANMMLKEDSTKRLKKHREFTIKSLMLRPLEFTPSGAAQVSASILKKMAGSNLFGDDKDAVWGSAYGFFGGGEAGAEACRAIGALAAIGQIDATINNFLVPLQALVDKHKRIHCSLNLNTETGRLSSRRPNLQNQPALEKDQYKIRDAFVAEPGNTLIVADYGQLELRLLAHITGCQSMIEAFKSGGCFHSRTAVGMYPYVKEAVDTGKVLLEWDYSKGQPTVPLVKDTYASERRKAKTLNFSIAYGKTVHGLAADWGITTDEAEETLEAWYRDRPEVKDWQDRTRHLARQEGYVRTMMGRYRRLPDAGTRGPAGSHALRAAINTPIQGSAADIVVVAMLKLHRSQKLKDLGWKLLLQIHDEVILEGPKESHKEALEEVRSCMQNPFDGFGLNPLRVNLDVDAKSADSWYKAK